MTPLRRQTSSLLINEAPLQMLPSLACAIGDREALAMQQLHYLLGRTQEHAADRPEVTARHFHDGRWWIWNTYDDWQRHFPFWSADTIYRVFRKLVQRGLVLTGNFNQRGGDQTLWYAIDYDALEALFADDPDREIAKCPRESAKADPQIAEGRSANCGRQIRKLRRPLPIDSLQENPAESLPSVEGEVVAAPAPAAPPPPPPPRQPIEEEPDGAISLPELAVQRFRALYPARASPAQDRRIRRDVGALLERVPLPTARGLEYALLEAAGKKDDPWQYAVKVLKAKPDGPEPGREEGTNDQRSTRLPPAIQPGRDAGNRAAARDLITRLRDAGAASRSGGVD